MELSIVQLVLGPLQNNVFLIGDEDCRKAVVIDPSFDSGKILEVAEQRGWTLTQVWLTHAHFDHTAGVADVSKAFEPHLPVCMHREAEQWALTHQNALQFGFTVAPPSPADRNFQHGQLLSINGSQADEVIEVREAPGHSPGSLIFYCATLSVAICGDVIFRESIGRTDLPGGDYDTLIGSIREQVLSLPLKTILLPGHGPESSVEHELKFNPYLA